ncbi:MAG: RlmE family RNA methyltransferase [Alphaproteobacteria bacterium]|nr:RlmE family RNA methyltransferase [Alphaproteobacteria bacterium]
MPNIKTAKGRPASSTRWLARQIKDPYVRQARQQGWRSRAAFKLIEVDDKHRFLKPGAKVVDLGCAPGGWTQVAAARTKTKVLGLDLLPVAPISGAQILQMDFTSSDAPARLKQLLGGKANVVLSDLAPNTTGDQTTDHLRLMGVLNLALDFALETLDNGGVFLCKIFAGREEAAFFARLRRHFTTVKRIKPPASRKESVEYYILATGYRLDKAD